MDRRERFGDTLVAIRAALQDFQSGVWTAMPATLQKFTASEMTCEAQPAIQYQSLGPKGIWTTQNMPLCVDCPVVFPGGSAFLLTFPLAVGDEGLLVFASRCIDSWWAQGGVQGQAELRMHDLSDGFFIPGCFSKPNAPSNVSTSTVQLRNKTGDQYLELDPGTGRCNVVATGGLWVNGVMVSVP